jgi:hypothetical protein
MDHAYRTIPTKAKKKMKSAASLSRWLKLAKSPIEAYKITHSVYSSRRIALPAERSKTSANNTLQFQQQKSVFPTPSRRPRQKRGDQGTKLSS